ncbi:MAG: carboxypeptidase-like regulatory domain-containing protein, partial [Chitinophagaceae bacterium]|nr:carboxypeptidase-like regulatory domain-containing protein [Chitinophagaceae bacterium]
MRQKRFPRVIAATIVLLLLSTSLFAQKRLVTGIISDQNNAPLSGATVTVKGEKEVTTTDANGAFRIAVSSDKAVLVVSYVGAKDIEIGTEGKIAVSASVAITDTKLSEVVVIGYGSKKRADISSSISSVSSKDLKDLPVAGIDQALQGKVAGVTVTNNSGQPGGG